MCCWHCRHVFFIINIYMWPRPRPWPQPRRFGLGLSLGLMVLARPRPRRFSLGLDVLASIYNVTAFSPINVKYVKKNYTFTSRHRPRGFLEYLEDNAI